MQHIIITPAQSRAARGLLGMTAEEVRKAAGLGNNTLQRFERGITSLNVSTLQKLFEIYARLGIEFPDANTVRYIPAEMDQAA